MNEAQNSGQYRQIKETLRNLYLRAERPWLVGFSGGKDSTMVTTLIFDVVSKIPAERRTKLISVVCTDTRVEIPPEQSLIAGIDRAKQ